MRERTPGSLPPRGVQAAAGAAVSMSPANVGHAGERTRLVHPNLIALKAASLLGPYTLCDAFHNFRHVRAQKRILILRHSGRSPHFYDYILGWLQRELPEVRRLFELSLLPCYRRDWSPYVAVVPWLQDPVEDWSPRAFRHLNKIAEMCRKRSIRVVNRVDQLSNAVKSTGASLIASVGIRTPRIVSLRRREQIGEILQEIGFPALIREDRRHGGPTFLAKEPSDMERIRWEQYRYPIAMEFVDTRSRDDGRYRKHRYVAAGEVGVPRHLIVSDHWEVRARSRLVNDALREQELAYLDSPDPHHDQLQRARKALGLDVVAFDYSHARNGELVVWEANPYPGLGYPKADGVDYIIPFAERSFACLVRHYLVCGGLPVPSKLEDVLGPCSA